MARVLVVGAGLSGLAVAARLARLRHEVTVLERTSGPGGAAGRLERDGFGFDLGPSLVHLPAAYRDLFVKTGKNAPLESLLELRPVPTAVRWEFADGTSVDLPNASRAGTMDALSAALGASAADQWDRFIATGDEVWAQFRQGFLAGPLPPAQGWRAGRAARAAHAALHPAKSYADLMDRHLKDQRLRQAGGSYLRRLGSDPDRAPATAVLWPWLEHTFGAWEVVGGIGVLVDAIADRARLRGAELRYDTEVIGIDTADGAVRGVRTADGTTLPADVVVAAVDDVAVDRWCPGSVPTPGERSDSAVVLLLALREGPAAPIIVSFPAEPGSSDPTLFLSPAQAPEGNAGLTVIAPGARQATAIIGVLDARGHRISERLLWHEIRQSAALVGPAVHGRHALRRAPNATSVGGLFHVGSAAHPGPGVDLAPLGGALVAENLGRARPGN